MANLRTTAWSKTYEQYFERSDTIMCLPCHSWEERRKFLEKESHWVRLPQLPLAFLLPEAWFSITLIDSTCFD